MLATWVMPQPGSFTHVAIFFAINRCERNQQILLCLSDRTEQCFFCTEPSLNSVVWNGDRVMQTQPNHYSDGVSIYWQTYQGN